VNPYGLEYWTYIIRALAMPRPEITEWASIVTAWRSGLPREPLIYYAGLAGFTVLLAAWARWREVTPMLVLGLTLCLGLKHLRHQIFFLLAAGAYLPVLLQAYFHQFFSRDPLLSWRLRLGKMLPVALALCFTLIYGYKFAGKSPLSLEVPATVDEVNKAGIHYPVGAVEFLRKSSLSGKLLNEFNWGEYLIWELYPRFRVAMDGRYETVYGDELYRLHSDFFYGRPGWRQFLTAYPPDLILVDPRSQVFALLRTAPDWRQVYGDAGAALFVRQVQTSALPGGK
jgi:hypothetical protein